MTKILLVEDDKSLREIYAVRLVEEGYDIVSAGDGEEALAIAIKERPGLIISDVMMPKISGFDMLDILRSTTETKDIKVIMMTALSSEDQRQRGVSLGADRYLVKSQVGIEDVVHAVHDVLGDATASNPATAPLVSAPAEPIVTSPVMGAPEIQQPQTPAFPPVHPNPAPAPNPVFTQPSVTTAPVTAPAAPSIQPGFSAQPSVSPQPAVNFAPNPTAPAAPHIPAPAAPASDLPQPTAPFSTPRPAESYSNRVIEPIQPSGDAGLPDINKLMEQALSSDSTSTAPASPQPMAPPAPASPEAPTQPAPIQPVTPPIPPTPQF